MIESITSNEAPASVVTLPNASAGLGIAEVALETLVKVGKLKATLLPPAEGRKPVILFCRQRLEADLAVLVAEGFSLPTLDACSELRRQWRADNPGADDTDEDDDIAERDPDFEVKPSGVEFSNDATAETEAAGAV